MDKVIVLVKNTVKNFEKRILRSDDTGISIDKVRLGIQGYHLALFYLNGKFFHIAKRITGIRYILTRSMEQPSAQFSILVIALMFFAYVSSNYS